MQPREAMTEGGRPACSDTKTSDALDSSPRRSVMRFASSMQSDGHGWRSVFSLLLNFLHHIDYSYSGLFKICRHIFNRTLGAPLLAKFTSNPADCSRLMHNCFGSSAEICRPENYAMWGNSFGFNVQVLTVPVDGIATGPICEAITWLHMTLIVLQQQQWASDEGQWPIHAPPLVNSKEKWSFWKLPKEMNWTQG